MYICKKTNVQLLDFDEMKIVSDLIEIANDNHSFAIAKLLTNLVIKKIQL